MLLSYIDHLVYRVHINIDINRTYCMYIDIYCAYVYPVQTCIDLNHYISISASDRENQNNYKLESDRNTRNVNLSPSGV